MIRIEEIKLSINKDEGIIKNEILNILGISNKELIEYRIIKKSIDSRNKKDICFKYTVDVKIEGEDKIFSGKLTKKIKFYRIRKIEEYHYSYLKINTEKKFKSPVIIGAGPAGLFAGIILSKAGLKPKIFEMGKDVDSRIKDVKNFFEKGVLSENSNVQFGEGGAGTFSDGKLYTLIKNERIKYVFEEFIEAGAPKEIAYDAKPHIGTDKLRTVVKNIRKKIVSLGGEIFFEKKLTDIKIKNNKICSVIINDSEEIITDDLILAIGHSSRDTFEMLLKRQLEICPKPFSIGLRIEHKKEDIDKAQYGNFYDNKNLPAAKYKLVAHLPNGRSVYTFCMCPGGYVVGATSDIESVVTNGMSEYLQDNENSNAAVLVNVKLEDFESDSPLAGIYFQKKWENKAYILGGSNYYAPSQLVGDFLNDKISTQYFDVKPTYKPGVKFALLKDCLPDYVVESIKQAMPIFDRKIKGFANKNAIFTGVETRSSSPVRILRNDFQSNIKGIFPAGEGSGYSGGIVSSAIDGIKVAETVIKKYQLS